MKKRRKKKYSNFLGKEDNQPPFYIMNRDARYYQGIKRGDIVFTDNPKKAKVFTEPRKIKVLQRWKPQEKLEIIYK